MLVLTRALGRLRARVKISNLNYTPVCTGTLGVSARAKSAEKYRTRGIRMRSEHRCSPAIKSTPARGQLTKLQEAVGATTNSLKVPTEVQKKTATARSVLPHRVALWSVLGAYSLVLRPHLHNPWFHHATASTPSISANASALSPIRGAARILLAFSNTCGLTSGFDMMRLR
eukprot:COSAG02_NODE_3380_length_6838_cov_9.133699_8_plen_172_part_00